MRFPKTLKPKNEEILSMYLQRVAKANYYNTRELIIRLGANPRHINHRIDVSPKACLNISQAAEFTGQSVDALLSMTFYPFEKKMVRSSQRTSIELLRELYDANRRFCPDCLKEYEDIKQYGIYNRIWQITDISSCNKHHTPLISYCRTCGARQPYFADSLVVYSCYSCGKKLYAKASPNFQVTSEQLTKIKEWSTLIDSDIEGLTGRSEVVYEVMITITLLFLLQKSSEAPINDISQDIITRAELNRAFNFIKYGCDYYLTPFMLLKYLNLMGLSAEDFFNTKVPDWFINKLLDFLKVDYSQLCYAKRNTELLRKHNEDDRKKSSNKCRVLKATVESIADAARQLRKDNRPLTYANVAELAGISKNYLKKKADFIRVIKNIKQN